MLLSINRDTNISIDDRVEDDSEASYSNKRENSSCFLINVIQEEIDVIVNYEIKL